MCLIAIDPVTIFVAACFDLFFLIIVANTFQTQAMIRKVFLIAAVLCHFNFGLISAEFKADHGAESESDAYDEPELWSSVLQEYAIKYGFE